MDIRLAQKGVTMNKEKIINIIIAIAQVLAMNIVALFITFFILYSMNLRSF